MSVRHFLLSTLATGSVFVSAPLCLNAQDSAKAPAKKPTSAAEKPWHEKLSVRGYAQFRYNRLLETNPLLQCEQCDRSWG